MVSVVDAPTQVFFLTKSAVLEGTLSKMKNMSFCPRFGLFCCVHCHKCPNSISKKQITTTLNFDFDMYVFFFISSHYFPPKHQFLPTILSKGLRKLILSSSLANC